MCNAPSEIYKFNLLMSNASSEIYTLHFDKCPWWNEM